MNSINPNISSIEVVRGSIYPMLELPAYIYNNRSNILITSDWHIKHKKVFETREDENNFRSLYEMDAKIITAIHDKLKKIKNPILYIIGDYYNVDFFEFLLHGVKTYIINGNHDYFNFDYKKKVIQELNYCEGYSITMIDNSDDSMSPDEKAKISYPLIGSSIIMVHNPVDLKHLTKEQLVFHGHYHNWNGSGKYSGYFKKGTWLDGNQFINVSLEHTNFELLTLEELLNMYKVSFKLKEKN